MTQDELKQAVARAALDYVVEGEIIGVEPARRLISLLMN